MVALLGWALDLLLWGLAALSVLVLMLCFVAVFLAACHKD